MNYVFLLFILVPLNIMGHRNVNCASSIILPKRDEVEIFSLVYLFHACTIVQTEISDGNETCDTRAHIHGYVCRAAGHNFGWCSSNSCSNAGEEHHMSSG